jgi:hypothetical protein
MPRLAPRKQRDHLQQHGYGEHPHGGAGGERGGELLAVPGEQEREERRSGQRPYNRDRHTSPATEVADVRSQLEQATRAVRPRHEVDRFGIRDRRHGAGSHAQRWCLLRLGALLAVGDDDASPILDWVPQP